MTRRLSLSAAALAPIAILVVAVVAPGDASAGSASRCVGTKPTSTSVAGFGPRSFNFGTPRLRVQLNWRDGTLRAGVLPGGGSIATIERDGSIHTKVGWWIRDGSRLVISGRRIDRAAPPLRAEVPSGYGVGFQPAGLTFPTVGCWRVSGRAGSARLTFVVRVVELQ